MSDIIVFSESADDEIKKLMAEMKIWAILDGISAGGTVTDDVRQGIYNLVSLVSDIFGTDLPAINIDPAISLQTSSRDLRLAHLFRERGLFRLYLLTKQEVWVDPGTMKIVSNPDDTKGLVRLPIFRTLKNPDKDYSEYFSKQEDFLGWFCREAHVARSLVFLRIDTIRRIISLGASPENAYQIIVTKPSAIYAATSELAGGQDKWKRGELTTIDPQVVEQVIERVVADPDKRDQLIELSQHIQQNPSDISATEQLKDAYKPILLQVLSEVAAIDSTMDARDYVKHDLLQKPKITYRLEPDSRSILVDTTLMSIDEKGQEFISKIVTTQFVPLNDVPDEVIRDLLSRLPISNRHMLDF